VVARQVRSFRAVETVCCGAGNQARALAKQDGNKLPSEFDAFYRAAETGDWQDATNLFEQMGKRIDADSSLRGSWWSATLDAYGVFEVFPPGDKYAIAFGNDIIKSIPAGSIYFGGTDAGRFAVTALQKSQMDGGVLVGGGFTNLNGTTVNHIARLKTDGTLDETFTSPSFFMLSQNPLADGTYLEYLRSMYAGKIYTPTDEDLQKSLQDYTTDAQHRLAHDQQFLNEPKQLKPGEEVRLDSNGQIQMSSHMNVIGVREFLTKTIFDKNPGHEFYIEESFPLDWMYPHLEPNGLIMKINRQQLPELSDEIVQCDSDYWAKCVTPMIGGWLDKDTPVKEVATFAEKVFVKKDLSGFAGDPQFIKSEYWCENFSKLRSAIGGLYEWRAQHATNEAERQRMNDAADFAFRQAWAVCPYSIETVFRYVNLLTSQDRRADALLVAETAAKMPENRGNDQLRSLVTELGKSQHQ